MGKCDDGGLAFPLVVGDVASEIGYGMTLLDYFAGKAIAGLAKDCGETCYGYMEGRAKVAYGFADAMIAEKRRRESDANPS